MALDINGNIISTDDITSTGVFETKINRDGLVLYLDAADKNSYPGTGTSWYDLTENGYVCVLAGSPSLVSSSYFSFNSAGSKYAYITKVASTPLWTFSDNFSISMIFRDNSSSTSWSYLSGFNDAESLNLFHKSGTRVFHNNGPVIEDTVDLYNSGWYIYTMTVRDSFASIYRNGVLVVGPTRLTTWDVATGSFQIAITNEKTAYGHANLDVSAIYVYDRPLQPYEVAENFQANRDRFSL